MSRTHVVAPGETLYAIAQRYGFASWRAIYEHAENAALRRRRPDPHVLHPGDEVVLPDACPGGTPVPLNRVTTVTRRRRGFQPIRLRLRDAGGGALAGEPFRLAYEGGEVSGETDDQGLVRAEVPASVSEARLTVGDQELLVQVGGLNPVDADTDDDGVSGAQARLRGLGYDPGPVDGILGPRTADALGDFQADSGLEVTEELDDATRRELARRYGC